jgi:transposase
MTVEVSVRPPTSTVNGDRDPAAVTGDRTRQVTSTGVIGNPGVERERRQVATIGVDIGGRIHVVARCRDGTTRADREILRVSQSRAGFAALDAWLERQTEPVTLVTMESSGHYWMSLASHMRRRDVPVAVVNPLAARYFAKSRLGRTKSDPADARSLAEMGMRDAPDVREPLEGAELRQAARFAMTLRVLVRAVG